MHKKLIVSIISILFLLSCGKKEDSKTTENVVKPIDVKVATLTQSNIKDEFILPGVVEAWEIVMLSAETTGNVKTIERKEGDRVKAGDLILTINKDTALLNLSNKKVNLETAKKDFERAKEMFAENAIAEKRFEMAKDALSLATVDYNLALDQYNKSVITTPIDGVINEIKPNIGEFVQAGQVIATIVQADKLKIYLNIPEKDLPYLKVGQSVAVYPANVEKDGESVKAQINYLSTISDPQTLTYKARVDLNASNDIRAGKIVRTKLLRKEYKDSFVVSLYSIVDRDDSSYVFVEENGIAREIEVKVNTLIGTDAIVSGNLKNGDRLIISGQHFLANNMPVKVAE